MTQPFTVGDWLVEPQLNQLTRNDTIVQLEPRAMDVLIYLVKHADQTMSRGDILDGVWNETAVVDGALSRAVHALRAALGDDAKNPTYIQTVPRRGYRLVAPVGAPTAVDTTDQTTAPPPVGPAELESTQSAPVTSRGIRTRPGPMILVLGLLLVLAVGVFAGGSPWRSRTPDVSSTQAFSPKSILVQPFQATTSTANVELLATGATETAIAILAGIEGLSVYAGGSSTSPATEVIFQGSVATTPPAADGTADTIVRLSGRLTRANGELLWGQVYEGDPSQILKLQADLVTDAALQLGRTIIAPASWTRDVNPDAYRLYLAGRAHLEDRRGESFERAQRTFESALAIDPNFAAAHAAIAETYLLRGDYLNLPEPAARALAAEAAREALRLDPAGVEATIAGAKVALDGNWDFAHAETLARKALSAAPGASEAWILLAEALAFSGRYDAAVDAADAAVNARPDSVLLRAQRANVYLATQNFERAASQFAEVLAMQPAYGWPARYRNYALERLGRTEEAVAGWVAHVDADPRFSDAQIADLQLRIDTSGSSGHWSWRKEHQVERLMAGGPSHPAAVAEAFAGSDEREKALEWVDRALEQRDDWLLNLLISPAFDSLRGKDLEERLAPHGIAHLARLR